MANEARKKIEEMIDDSAYLFKIFIYACESQKTCDSCPLKNLLTYDNRRCYLTFLTVSKMFFNYLESEEDLKPYNENTFVRQIIKLYKESKGD